MVLGARRWGVPGGFLYVNPALVRMLGYDSAEELLEKNIARDVYADPEDRARLFARYRNKGGDDGARVRWKTKQGRERIVLLYSQIVEEPDATYLDTSVLDVTDAEI